VSDRMIVPRSPNAFARRDAAVLGGCAASALAITWLLRDVLLPLQGAFGFLVTWFLMFVIMYRIVLRETEGPLAARDRLATVLITGVAFAVLIPLASILVFVFARGFHAFTILFMARTMATTGPADPATSGGALHAIVGTVEQVGLAVVLSVPLGILTGVYLQEINGRFARPVRMFVQTMSGVPSIVAGLFVFSFWLLGLGFGPSGFAASLALAILMLPTVTRTVEEVLRLVPGGLRESALSLGGTEWKSTWQVVLPTARAGILTAVILGMARVIGETAPLLMTSFGNAQMNWNPFSGPQESLPFFVWRCFRFGTDAMLARSFTGAMVLLTLVLVLFVATRVVGRGRLERMSSRGTKAMPVKAD
jgi:phosphate transport system permease protein